MSSHLTDTTLQRNTRKGIKEEIGLGRPLDASQMRAQATGRGEQKNSAGDRLKVHVGGWMGG